MKRFALSLLISFVLLAAYFFGVVLLVTFVFVDNEPLADAAVLPLRLPIKIAELLIPRAYAPSYRTTVLVVMTANVFIYADPIDFLMTQIARIKNSRPSLSDGPDRPPKFQA